MDGDSIDPHGLLAYMSRQADTLIRHAPTAFRKGGETHVHKARVAGRRLRTALALLEPVALHEAIHPLAKLARQIQKRLGNARDLDVMIVALDEMKLGASVLTLLHESLLKDRAREAANLKRCHQQIRPAAIRSALKAALVGLEEWLPAIEWSIRETTHDRWRRLAQRADAAIADNTALHSLRIEAKQIRYTLELATAIGFRIPAKVLKRLETIQEDLGVWHDKANLAKVFATAAAGCMSDDIRSAAALLKEAGRLAAKAIERADGCLKAWRKDHGALERMLAKAIPIQRCGRAYAIVNGSRST